MSGDDCEICHEHPVDCRCFTSGFENLTWIKWDDLAPPKDVKGILIRFEDNKIFTDAHYYSERFPKNIKPVEWTFMERTNHLKRSVKC